VFIRGLSLLLVFMLISCGGDGPGYTLDNAPAGIYSGTVTPAGGSAEIATAVITSTGKVALINVNTYEVFLGTRANNTFTGTLYASTSVPSTAVVTFVSGNNISGTYTSSLGGGSFALVADPNLFNRTSELSKLAGTWVDSVFTSSIGTSTWVIQTDGSFTVTTTSGCNATGSFDVFNTINNEYNLSMEITNCLGINGSYTGLAFVSDKLNSNDIISLSFSNGSIGGLSEPVKQ